MRERAITEAELQAFADGRLEDSLRPEVERWLAAHPEDAERIVAWKRINEAVREHYQPVLSERVPAALDEAARGGRHRSPMRWRVAALAASCAVLGAALGGFAGWQLGTSRGVPLARLEAASMAKRAAIAHAVYSPEVRHPVEVGADQEAHLVAWLSKRTGINLKVPKLEAAGMSLVGGRLLPGDTGPVAQFMYQGERGRRITLYIRAEHTPTRETSFRYAREGNVGVFYWIDRTSSYAIASSDLGKEELLAVANSVYKQLEP